MPAPPRRRWFQFGLRTMFVAIAFLAVPIAWVGYNLNWIRQRREFVAQEHSLQAAHLAKYGWEIDTKPTYTATFPLTLPIALRFLGEEGFEYLSVLTQVHSAKLLTSGERDHVARARSLFPEATIRTIHFFDLRPFGHGETVDEPE